jgi:hypothetical protein
VWVDEPYPTPDGGSVADPEFYRLGGVVVTTTHPGVLTTAQGGICLEPIKSGGVGLVRVAGLVAGRVVVNDADHEYADVADDPAGPPESADAGPFAILWTESTSGTSRATLLVLPACPAGPRLVPGKITAASATTDTVASSVTYTATSGLLELTAATPYLRPFASTQLITPAAVGSDCLMLGDTAGGTSVLLLAQEVQVLGACP